jgi:hypothetical protein
MSRIVGNSVSQPTQTPLRRATEEPISKKIIEEPISLTKEQLTIYSDPELTRLQEAVVRIDCDINEFRNGCGSAVIISPDGLAVTNKHVAMALFGGKGSRVRVTQPTHISSVFDDRNQINTILEFFPKNKNLNQNFPSQRPLSLHKHKIFFGKSKTESENIEDQELDINEFTADLLKIDPNSDLALIRINKNDTEDSFSFVSFEEGEVTLRAGDESYTLGHPYGTNFNVLRRGEVLNPIDDLSRSTFLVRRLINSKKIDRKRTILLESLKDANQVGISLAVNSFMAIGDSGGLQANPQGQLRGINSGAFYALKPKKLAELGLKPHNLSQLRMLSLAVPAQRVLDFIDQAGVNMNLLLRGQDVGVNNMKKVKPPKR